MTFPSTTKRPTRRLMFGANIKARSDLLNDYSAQLMPGRCTISL